MTDTKSPPERIAKASSANKAAAKPGGLTVDQKAVYDEVVEAAQLDAILMVKSSFEVEPGYYATDRSAPLKSDEFEYGFEMGNCEYEEDTEVVSIQVNWGVKVRGTDDQSLLKLASSFFVVYSGVATMDPAVVRQFARNFAPFASYPYFRGLVSQMGWLSGAHLPIMPVLKGPRRHSKAPQTSTTPRKRAPSER